MSTRQLQISYAEYRDKVLGGWLGKSLGGVVGAPLENHKQWNRLTLATLWPNKLMPNDDLDIQIVWLEAMQESGIHLTSRDLAEYWQDRCWYNFCEYGFFLYNVQRGIAPPLSGTWNNDFFRESEGCPIRSEIWGLVAPGDPELAAELARQDGQLDHGGVSVQIEQFNAAAVAQALVTDSLDRALEAALSVVPADGIVAASVPRVRRICRQYPDPCRAWRLVLREYGDRDASKAITNHALVLMALFLGELDFKKTMLLCVNSGWDTDCTAATAGALLGTLGGTSSLPADWIEKLGKNLFCAIAVKHKDAALTELADDTCRIGLEMAALRNRRVELTGAPEITVRPAPAPAVSIAVEYPQEPVLWNARPTSVRLVVENPTDASSRGALVLAACAGTRHDMPETSLAVPAHGRQEVVVNIRRDERGGWLPDKNLFEARWMEGGRERAWRQFGLGGARQWLVYGPYWDMWDKTRHRSAPIITTALSVSRAAAIPTINTPGWTRLTWTRRACCGRTFRKKTPCSWSVART